MELADYKDFFKSLSCLILDDDETNLIPMVGLMERWFGRVHSTLSAIEAIEIFKEFLPRVIIADVSMPEMSGFQFAEKISEIDKNFILVFTSGHSFDTYAQTVMDLKNKIDVPVIYLTKPLIYKDLLWRILEKVGDVKSFSV